MDVTAEALHGSIEDLVVVEGEFWEIVDKEPGCFFSIIATNDFGRLDQSIVGNGDYPLSGVTVRIRENAKFADGSGLQAGLFTQFTESTIFRGLVQLQETTGKSPASLIWLAAATDQQDLELAVFVGEYDAISRYGHVLVAVLIREFRTGNVCEILSHCPAKIGVFGLFSKFCVILTRKIWII